jgi:hypothetical protein
VLGSRLAGLRLFSALLRDISITAAVLLPATAPRERRELEALTSCLDPARRVGFARARCRTQREMRFSTHMSARGRQTLTAWAALSGRQVWRKDEGQGKGLEAKLLEGVKEWFASVPARPREVQGPDSLEGVKACREDLGRS